MTSSPGSQTASTVKNKNGLAPLPTSTRSGCTATPRVRDSSSAITARNSGIPALGQ